ncbi:hypothetical protein AB0L05_38915 [Nonomuraea pusilla]|uniref:hypothetical protein n=1 Tax=Nonomuraea pusilla TaxID=46177 RepID=UPI0033250EFB
MTDRTPGNGPRDQETQGNAMPGGGMPDSEIEFRAVACRLAQAIRHHPRIDDVEPLREPARHLETLLAADAEVDHVENAALAVIDIYDRSDLEIADPAVVAAIERLRDAAAELDETT